MHLKTHIQSLEGRGDSTIKSLESTKQLENTEAAEIHFRAAHLSLNMTFCHFMGKQQQSNTHNTECLL